MDDFTAAPRPEQTPVEELAVGPTEDVEDGTYEAELSGITSWIYDSPDGPRELLTWSFSVDGPDGPVVVEGVSSRSSSLRSKAVAWVQAVNGPVKPGQSLRVADLVGKRALVTVEHARESGFPKVVAVTAPPKAKAR